MATQTDGSQLVTYKEAARILGVSHVSLRRAAINGDVPVVRIGTICRIPRAWIQGRIAQAIERVDLPLEQAWQSEGLRPVAVPVYHEDGGNGSV